MTISWVITLIAVLQTPAAATTQTATLLEEARRLATASTNEARFEVLTSALRSRGLTFEIEPFSIEKPLRGEPRTEGRNVVVTFGEGNQDIVLGAHYDAARLPDGALAPGAVDNAASSVMLVRLAEMLRVDRLPFRLRVVWFDMEELGLIGSAQYIKRHSADRIAAMLNFDVNGYGDTVLFGPAERPDNAPLRRTFVETCGAEDVACVPFVQMPPGDDRSFVAARVPTMSVALLPGIEAHQLWLMLNGGKNSGLAEGQLPSILKTIHTREDTPDRLEEEAMQRMLRFALALVRRAAKSDLAVERISK